MYTIGEFAQMGKVTVRTLQYYDEISLLKPTKKTDGGNRLYGKNEVAKLQQITALKFMGYSLDTIKQMLGTMNHTMEESLEIQLQFIKSEKERMNNIEKAIRAILQSMTLEEELNWNLVTKVMNLYQENNNTAQRYLDDHFTQEEQNALENLPRLGEDDEKVQVWMELIKEVKINLDQEPSSEIAQSIAKRWMDQVTSMFADNEELRDKSWGEIKNNNNPIGSYPLESDVIEFIEKAVGELYKEQNSSKNTDK
ncbi:MerR family transcriptional regulator [Virgibacillus oceani]